LGAAPTTVPGSLGMEARRITMDLGDTLYAKMHRGAAKKRGFVVLWVRECWHRVCSRIRFDLAGFDGREQ